MYVIFVETIVQTNVHSYGNYNDRFSNSVSMLTVFELVY